MKVDVDCFSCNNPLKAFKFMKNVGIVVEIWWNNGRKESLRKRTIHNRIFSVLIFENIMLLSRGLRFEICWFSKGYNGRW